MGNLSWGRLIMIAAVGVVVILLIAYFMGFGDKPPLNPIL